MRANALQTGSFSNPAYPFYTPQHLPTAKKMPANTDDDLELLRKYGLDQFHLSESNGMSNGGARMPSTSAQAGRRTNWMTFDWSIDSSAYVWNYFRSMKYMYIMSHVMHIFPFNIFHSNARKRIIIVFNYIVASIYKPIYESNLYTLVSQCCRIW